MYAVQSIRQLLLEEKIPTDDVIDPVGKERHVIPLEIFDDTEFECRTPEEWLELGIVHFRCQKLDTAGSWLFQVRSSSSSIS